MLTELSQTYGPLEFIQESKHSLTYRNGRYVLKLYREKNQAVLEAENLRRAGLQHLIHDVQVTEAGELLVTHRFPGLPVTAQTLRSALPGLKHFLDQLHQQKSTEQVNLTPVVLKLQQFQDIRTAENDFLFVILEKALQQGLLETHGVFCHLDLWSNNILVASDGEVLVIDWVRARFDDPMRDIALLKAGTLDLLPEQEALQAALAYVKTPAERERFTAYLALTYLNDLHWIPRNTPHTVATELPFKLERAQHALGILAGF
ncbi:phosphotransferase family protein [Deinococcus roseus]|uniref:Aminoglycoside phosphotransferase n=1 Tax=Deinococcus roseus TaxID=392414 RepID=A0ABQ2CUN5_9DEIO|nr:aminoglycoside phosphotransferase family protein [Deinococcus roseus]GGJ22411.1 aminoglycoside phosphotransferase [Deinococcus roseus]